MKRSLLSAGTAVPVLMFFFIYFSSHIRCYAQTFATTRTSSGLIAYDIVLGVLTSPSPTTSTLYGSVTDTAFITDGSLSNAATLTARCFNILAAGRAGEAWIQTKFPVSSDAGNTVYVRIDLPTSSGLSVDILSTVGDLTHLFTDDLILVAAYSGATTTDTGSRVSSAKVKKALVKDTAGNYYVAVTPDSAFNAVRVGLRFNTGILGVTLGASVSMKVYYGVRYTLSECDGRASYTDLGIASGVSVPLLDSVVNNPVRAIDSSLSTFSRIGGSGLVTLGVASTLAQTIYFRSADSSADHIRLIMNTPGTVLDLSLANGIRIAAYRQDTLVSEQSLATLLSLDALTLFGSAAGITVLMNPGAPFDRVTISYHHLVGVAVIGSGIRVYDVRSVPARPVLSQDTTLIYIYTTPAVTASARPGNEVRWFNSSGTHMGTGSSFPFVDTIANSAWYHARSARIPCANLSDTAGFWVKVIPLTYTDPVVGTQSAPYAGTAVTLAGAGIAGAGFRYILDSGSVLPPGITLNSNGTLSGTPSVTDTGTFTVLLFDTVNNMDAGKHTFNLVIRAPLVLPPMTLPAGTASAPYSIALTPATGGTGNYTYSLSASTPLPSGMGYDPLTHTLSGSAAAGTYTFRIDVQDDEGRSGTQLYLFELGAALPIYLEHFSGEQQGATVHLSWRTGAEHHIQQLQLQCSKDGKIWQCLSECRLTHSQVYRYAHQADSFFQGTMLYRLMLKASGATYYSTVLRFLLTGCTAMPPLKPYPNPAFAGELIQVNREEMPAKILLFDAQGRKVVSAHGVAAFHLPDLSPGQYVLMIEYESRNTESATITVL